MSLPGQQGRTGLPELTGLPGVQDHPELTELTGLPGVQDHPEVTDLTELTELLATQAQTAPVVVPAVRDHPALVGSPLQTAPTLLSTV